MEQNLNIHTKNVAKFQSTIESYGDYHFAIFMDIYLELSDYPYCSYIIRRKPMYVVNIIHVEILHNH